MAGNDRQPQERSSDLPRRVPGVNGRTPGQIRRGFLPMPADGLVSRAASPEARPAEIASPGGQLPQRTPGISAIQPAPRLRSRQVLNPTPPAGRVPGRPTPSRSPDSGATDAPSPTAMAASAAGLLRRPGITDTTTTAPSATPSPTAAAAAAAAAAPTATPAPADTTSPATPTPSATATAPAIPVVPATSATPASAAPPASASPPAAAAPASTPPRPSRSPGGPSPSGSVPLPSGSVPSPSGSVLSPSGSVPPPAAVPPRSKQGRLLAGRPARRWRLAGLLIAIVVVLAALVATAVFHAGSRNPECRRLHCQRQPEHRIRGRHPKSGSDLDPQPGWPEHRGDLRRRRLQ